MVSKLDAGGDAGTACDAKTPTSAWGEQKRWGVHRVWLARVGRLSQQKHKQLGEKNMKKRYQFISIWISGVPDSWAYPILEWAKTMVPRLKS